MACRDVAPARPQNLDRPLACQVLVEEVPDHLDRVLENNGVGDESQPQSVVFRDLLHRLSCVNPCSHHACFYGRARDGRLAERDHG